MYVRELPGSHKPVMTVAPALLADTVARQMRAARVGALVVSRDGERIEGIISERDIVWSVAVAGAAALSRTAAQLMTTPVRTCAPRDNLVEVMRTMQHHRIRHVPVCEDGRLVGLISIGDVMATLLAERELETTMLREINLAHS